MKRLALALACFGAIAAVDAAHAGVSLVAGSDDVVPRAGGEYERPGAAPGTSDSITIDASADPSCDFAPPQPALVGARYADYRVAREHEPSGDPHQLVESATLADGTRVRIVSFGCVDSTGRTFHFTFAQPQRSADDVVFWAQQARTTLDALALHKDVAGVDDLRKFLGRAATLKRNVRSIVQCRDGKQPADGDCAWESGGGLSLRIEPQGATLGVELTFYQSG